MIVRSFVELPISRLNDAWKIQIASLNFLALKNFAQAFVQFVALFGNSVAFKFFWFHFAN